MNGSIVLVEDDLDAAMILRDSLRRRGLDVHEVHSAQACLDWVKTHPADVVVTDVMMPGTSGIELCAQLKQTCPEALTIVVTGQSGLETAIEAIRAGAYDYIVKPVKADVLAIAVARALEHVALKQQLTRLREQHQVGWNGIVGASSVVRKMNELVERVAPSDATVLVTGESGTGKELVARALHDLSPRRNDPFIAINCAAMPAPLLESELFGHVRGAFTDAKRSRPGLLAQAGNGTIFLDEIGEMPLEMQVKLLRVLQERTMRPVGGDEEQPFHARVITATNRNLEVEVAERRFREDLFYRIHVVSIAVPPLREREGDILLLAHHFLRRSAQRINKPVRTISQPAARMLIEYDWPGNIRELENCMERAVALTRLDEITVDDLPRKIVEHNAAKIIIDATSHDHITLDQMERRYVRQVLAAVGGNKTHAARILGIDRRSLYRRLEEPVGEHTDQTAPAPPAAPGN